MVQAFGLYVARCFVAVSACEKGDNGHWLWGMLDDMVSARIDWNVASGRAVTRACFKRVANDPCLLGTFLENHDLRGGNAEAQRHSQVLHCGLRFSYMFQLVFTMCVRKGWQWALSLGYAE